LTEPAPAPFTPVSAPPPPHHHAAPSPYDLIGVGIGPFNLSLAALADGVPGLRTLFLDEKPEFSWHPGMLIEGTTLQVPFLADPVTLVDPTSPWSFLAYLREHDRLFPFYFAERFHIGRREYDHYLKWVTRSLPSCHNSAHVDSIDWDQDRAVFNVRYTDTETRQAHTAAARHLVLGVGTEPVVPPALRPLLGPRVFHTADYLARRPGLDGLRDVTVLGSGQSGAEVLLDLLRTPPAPDTRLRWLTRSPAFAPMEYSKLGLEHFTPDYTRHFRGLPEPVRDRLVPRQWQLYKAISAETIAAIYDTLYDLSATTDRVPPTLAPNIEVTGAQRTAGSLELTCRHTQLQEEFSLQTDAVVLGTGYAARRPPLLEPIEHLVDWDAQDRYRVDAEYRVSLAPEVTGRLYVQNAELHTHGVGAPDLGLAAYRAAVILNSLTGRAVYRLPKQTAYTTFGIPEATALTSAAPSTDRPASSAPEAPVVPADPR
jgi:lysine N6-hydroxylase